MGDGLRFGWLRSGLDAISLRFRPRTGAAPAPRGPAEANGVLTEVVRPLLRDPRRPEARARLLVFADGPGATQTISFVLPLQALRDKGEVELTIVNETDFDALSPANAGRCVAALFDDVDPSHVVVSRCGGLAATGVVNACEARGLDYVMHLDDNLFAVPAELGPAKHEKYSSPDRLHRLRLLCERAAAIYVSTEGLGEQIGAMGFTPPVVAGEIYCAVPAPMAPPRRTGERVFGYMGTAGHADDLEMVAPAIERALEQFPDAVFETFGSIRAPASVKKKFPGRVRERKAAGSYLEFIEAFKAMNWRCGLAPLRDTPFNACKANTKFIEYATAGIPVVASAVPVYRDLAAEGRGALAHGPDEWAASIAQFLAGGDAAAEAAGRAQDYVSARYSMDALARQVVKVLKLPLA